MIRPNSLKPGDRLAVLCGSSPTSLSQEELASAVRAMGLEPVFYPSAMAKHGYLSGTDAVRAADLNAAFADDSIQGTASTGSCPCWTGKPSKSTPNSSAATAM